MAEDPGLRAKAQRWLDEDPDPQTAAELRVLLATDTDAARAELADRFSGTLEFGTAGLRGVLGAGPNRMNRAVIRRTALGLAKYLEATVPNLLERGIVVGRDGRRLSRELAEDAARVFAAQGIPALVFPELAPTPLTAFATLRFGAAAGVMVTASHNPPEYNGFKVYWGNGAQIVPPHDVGIARDIDRAGPAHRVPLLGIEDARQQGLWRDIGDDVREEYLEGVLALRRHPAKSDLRIVYTAMHGVGGAWVEEALQRAQLGVVQVVREQHAPDGSFPTVRFPNPEEPGAMDLARALAEKSGAELVLANDPDADRLAVQVRDADGRLVALSGNEVGVLLGHYALTQGPLPQKRLAVTTIVSSAQLKALCDELGAAYEETLTGFKWIANRSLAREEEDGATFVFGYEEALGYCVGRLVRDKDGISAAVVFADLAAWCKARGTTVLGYLEEIQRRHGLFVGAQRNFTFPGAQGQSTIAGILEAFRARPVEKVGSDAVVAVHDYKTGEARAAGVTRKLSLPSSNVLALELEGGGRVTLRPSGTEPKIKYYFELKELLRGDEPMQAARARAQARLDGLIESFLQLARERGQP